MYVNNEDSKRLWYELQMMKEDSAWNEYKLPVPVSTLEHLWVTVDIVYVSKNPDLFQVQVLNPKTSENEPAGYLYEGDGRNAIRLLVYNWFIPKLVDLSSGTMRELKCNATSHGPNEHKLMRARLTDGGHVYAEQWRLYFIGRCTSCEKKLAAASSYVPLG